MEKLVNAYIESKKNAWSETTLKKEAYRLRGITLEHLDQPALLHQALKEKGLKPYSLRTSLVRAGDFAEWLLERGELKGNNKVKAYVREHANEFKHAYHKKPVGMTWEEAVERIKTIKDDGTKQKAMELLFTGMRYSESETVATDGTVVGKGGWHREVPMAKEMKAKDFDGSYYKAYRALKKIGLTPHQLRKLAATKAAELGADIPTLMSMFGWRTVAMPALYLQDVKKNEVNERLRKLLPKKETKGESDK